MITIFKNKNRFIVYSPGIVIQHPDSMTVPKGSWTNFTCSVNHQYSYIEWRIGVLNVNGTEYFAAEHLPMTGIKSKHLQIEISHNVEKRQQTQTIRIFPSTDEWNNTALQCREILRNVDRKFYSKFAILFLESSDECPLG